jgi:precorrin-3B synthase
MIDLAEQFLKAAGRRIWHVRELPLGGRELLAGVVGEPSAFARVPGTGVSLGRMTQRDGRELVSALVPLGLLTGDQLTALVEAASLGSGELIVTPWRGVLVPDLPAAAAQPVTRILRSAGLVVDDGSAWRGITACTGAPRCAHGLGETRSLATSIAAERGARSAPDPLLPVHVIGCGRGCGSPSGEHLELLTDGQRAEIRRGAAVVEVPLAAAARTVQESRPAVAGGKL